MHHTSHIACKLFICTNEKKFKSGALLKFIECYWQKVYKICVDEIYSINKTSNKVDSKISPTKHFTVKRETKKNIFVTHSEIIKNILFKSARYCFFNIFWWQSINNQIYSLQFKFIVFGNSLQARLKQRQK